MKTIISIFLKYTQTFARIVCKAVKNVVYICIASVVTLLTSCESLTPTRVPPLADSLGYNVPSFCGWTTTGLNEFTYKLESEKLSIFRTLVDMVNIPALATRESSIDWLNAGLAAGLFGSLPFALKRVPKGAVSKEEHEAEIERVGNMKPQEFRNMRRL